MRPNGRFDALAMAESVAAGRLTLGEAEDEVRAAFGRDVKGAEREIAELRDLVVALTAVGRHVSAFRSATAEDAARAAGSARSVSRRPLVEGTPTPERVERSPVRRRVGAAAAPAAGLPRPAIAFAFAAVVVIVGAALVVSLRPATVSVGASPTPALPGTPVPSAPGPATPLQTSITPQTPPTSVGQNPVPTSAVAAIPVVLSQALVGAPGVAFWSPTGGVFIQVWSWHSGGGLELLCTLDTWPDTTPGVDRIERYVSVAPDGSHVAFEEWAIGSTPMARLRIFDTNGTVIWTAPVAGEQGAYLPFVWSPDGRTLAIGSAPGPWQIVTIDVNGRAQADIYRLAGSQNAFGITGFSQDGSLLYGYNTEGEAEFYERPEALDLTRRRVEQIDTFPTGPTGLAPSNGTTRVDSIAKDSGLVLAQGGLAKGEPYWMVKNGPEQTQLQIQASNSDLAWTQDGRIAVSQALGERPQRSISLRESSYDTPSGALSPAGPEFTIGAGDYDAAFEGARGEFALYVVSSVASGTEIDRLGYDEAILVHLPDATSSVAIADGRSADGTGFHFAGWLP